MQRQLKRVLSALLGVILSLLLLGRAFATDVAIVANKNVPVSSLTRDQIRDVFTGSMSQWDNGKKIAFIVFIDGGDVHHTFLERFVGKTPEQFQAYWKKQIFTGKGAEPKTVRDEKEVLDFIAKTDGAIGYVTAGAVNSSVKTISVK